MQISDIETANLDVMERNLRRAAEYTQAHNLRFRPHAKTHKNPSLARKQLDLGAVGLTVAKVGEAEVMQRAKPRDILVAYPILGDHKLGRLMKVASEVPITVALDSIEAAGQLSRAACQSHVEISVLLEMDIGFGRVGVKPVEVHELAGVVRRLPCLRLVGLSFFPAGCGQEWRS